MNFFPASLDHEVSDVITAHDPQTMARMPVRKQEILRLFKDNCQAQSVINQIPEQEGFLDTVAVAFDSFVSRFAGSEIRLIE